eukprot:m51a1_g2296 hypothetical protein (327) ;mRNA; f:421364-422344
MSLVRSELAPREYEAVVTDSLRSSLPFGDFVLFVRPAIPAAPLARALARRSAAASAAGAPAVAPADVAALLVTSLVISRPTTFLLVTAGAWLHWRNPRSSRLSPGLTSIAPRELAACAPARALGPARVHVAGRTLDLRHSGVAAADVERVLCRVAEGLRAAMAAQAVERPLAGPDEAYLDGAYTAAARRAVAAALSRYAGVRGLHGTEGVPAKQMRRARTRGRVPDEEMLWALVDATMFGNASRSLLMGDRGLWLHNGWASRSPGAWHVPWREFAAAHLCVVGLEVHVGCNIRFETSAFGLDLLLTILTEIQADVVRLVRIDLTSD